MRLATHQYIAFTFLIGWMIPSFASAQPLEAPVRADREPFFAGRLSDRNNTLLEGVPSHFHFLYELKSSPKDDLIRKQLPFEQIELTRTSCLGNCPAYVVKFTIEGESRYQGFQFADRKGYYAGEISLYDFARVCWAIERLRILDENRRFNRTVEDTPETTIRITLRNDSHPKEISDFGGPSPIELQLVAAYIHQITKRIEWKEWTP